MSYSDGRVIKFGAHEFDYAKLDSATKYPSILTYHFLDEANRGRMNGEVNPEFKDLTISDLYCSEKIDGTNCRIIISNGIDKDSTVCRDFMIGGRDAIFYSKGDRIYNPANQIVEGFLNLFENVYVSGISEELVVVYGEIYGGNLPASKNYTSNKYVGFRVFDVRRLNPENIINDPIQKICYDRDHFSADDSHMSWMKCSEIYEDDSIVFVSRVDGKEFHLKDLVSMHHRPYVESMLSEFFFPNQIEDSYEFLIDLGMRTRYSLDSGLEEDENSDILNRRCEGYVFRTNDRSKCFKMRFEDYERTIFNHRNPTRVEIDKWLKSRNSTIELSA